MIRRSAHLLAACAVLATLPACQAPYPNDAKASTVRAIMASQVVAPRARTEDGSANRADAASAVAAYANYQNSFVTPTPQADSPTFGNK